LKFIFYIIAFSEHAIEQLREEVAQQKRISIIEQAEIPSDEEYVTMFRISTTLYYSRIKSLKQIIQKQTEELRDLMEKNLFQDELNQQK